MHSDESLYYAAHQGSVSAYRDLYQRYERPLFGFLQRRVGNRQDAEEIFQEAMLAILKTPAVEFEAGLFASWLYRVAFNLALNRLRSRRREAGALMQMQLTSLSQDVQGAGVCSETQTQLHQAAQSLGPELRRVYDLRTSGKSYEEMAGELGVAMGTIKSRMHLIVKRLRREMTKWSAF